MENRSKNVEIEVFPIAKTVVDRTEVRKWLDHLGATEYEIPAEEAATNAALIVALAAKQCYLSFQPGLNPNVTKVRSELTEYLDNIISSGHGSVLEHATFTFAINNVSRVFTGEMNRHRAGWAISERSMRYIRFDQCINWWLPLMLRDQEEDDATARRLKYETRLKFHRMFAYQSNEYDELVRMWDVNDVPFHVKKQITSCLRRIIGMGCATGGVWTGNVRALRHVIALRTDPSAEEEIAFVFRMIAWEIHHSEPHLFRDLKRQENGSWTTNFPKV